jgi:hypothetical protein
MGKTSIYSSRAMEPGSIGNVGSFSPGVWGRLSRADRRQEWFIKSAGLVLAITGFAKVLSAIGHARALDTADPLVGISFRLLLLLVGQAEVLVAFFCLFTQRRSLSLAAVAWLSTNFLVYRLGLWFIGWHKPCACMGSLTEMLHLSPQAADNIMKVVLAYLLVGSYAILIQQWRQSRGTKLADGGVVAA